MMKACPGAMAVAVGRDERIKINKWHVRELGLMTNWLKEEGWKNKVLLEQWVDGTSHEWYYLILIYIVLVFCCYITKYHRFSSLKWYSTFSVSQFLSQESRLSLGGSSAQGHLRLQQKCWLAWVFIWQVNWGGFMSRLTLLVNRFIIL